MLFTLISTKDNTLLISFVLQELGWVHVVTDALSEYARRISFEGGVINGVSSAH